MSEQLVLRVRHRPEPGEAVPPPPTRTLLASRYNMRGAAGLIDDAIAGNNAVMLRAADGSTPVVDPDTLREISLMVAGPGDEATGDDFGDGN